MMNIALSGDNWLDPLMQMMWTIIKQSADKQNLIYLLYQSKNDVFQPPAKYPEKDVPWQMSLVVGGVIILTSELNFIDIVESVLMSHQQKDNMDISCCWTYKTGNVPMLVGHNHHGPISCVSYVVCDGVTHQKCWPKILFPSVIMIPMLVILDIHF